MTKRQREAEALAEEEAKKRMQEEMERKAREEYNKKMEDPSRRGGIGQMQLFVSCYSQRKGS